MSVNLQVAHLLSALYTTKIHHYSHDDAMCYFTSHASATCDGITARTVATAAGTAVTAAAAAAAATAVVALVTAMVAVVFDIKQYTETQAHRIQTIALVAGEHVLSTTWYCNTAELLLVAVHTSKVNTSNERFGQGTVTVVELCVSSSNTTTINLRHYCAALVIVEITTFMCRDLQFKVPLFGHHNCMTAAHQSYYLRSITNKTAYTTNRQQQLQAMICKSPCIVHRRKRILKNAVVLNHTPKTSAWPNTAKCYCAKLMQLMQKCAEQTMQCIKVQRVH
eukprot:7569-Heterococcus_DN1.PRE.2